LVHHTARFLSWFSATDEIANRALPIAQAASDTDSSARRFKKRQHVARVSGFYGARDVNAQLIATLLTVSDGPSSIRTNPLALLWDVAGYNRKIRTNFRRLRGRAEVWNFA
jgi:hypothetical protein